MSSVETGQMSAVPESSGFAWACGGMRKRPQGVARGEESEEGESVHYRAKALPQHPLLF